MRKSIIVTLMVLIFGVMYSNDNTGTRVTLGLSPLVINENEPEDNEILISGSLSAGIANGRRETLYELYLAKETIEINAQNRIYFFKDATGIFAGTFLSAGYYTMKTYIERYDGGLVQYVGNEEGMDYYSWGVRAGGNIGVRWMLIKNVFITPRLGITLPILQIQRVSGYSNADMVQLQFSTMVMKMPDAGLHLEVRF